MIYNKNRVIIRLIKHRFGVYKAMKTSQKKHIDRHRVTEARHYRNKMKETELADKTGINYNTLVDYIKKESIMDYSLQRIAACLNVHPDYLTGKYSCRADEPTRLWNPSESYPVDRDGYYIPPYSLTSISESWESVKKNHDSVINAMCTLWNSVLTHDTISGNDIYSMCSPLSFNDLTENEKNVISRMIDRVIYDVFEQHGLGTIRIVDNE